MRTSEPRSYDDTALRPKWYDLAIPAQRREQLAPGRPLGFAS